jgi:hypothetical protein
MNVRSKVDKLLRDGYPISDDDTDSVAISGATVLRLIEALDGSKLAIRGIEIWRMENWGPMPTDEKWVCKRLTLEAAPDYASRSRQAARVFLKGRKKENSMEVFTVDIDEQQEAA